MTTGELVRLLDKFPKDTEVQVSVGKVSADAVFECASEARKCRFKLDDTFTAEDFKDAEWWDIDSLDETPESVDGHVLILLNECVMG